MLFIHSGTDIAKAFGVELISSPEMSSALTNWDRISTGKPPWLNAEDEIGTINMAKHISDTRAKLVTLDIGIAISGSSRADYLQGLADDLLKRLPDRVSEAERLGGIMLKWNGETWDFILPGNFGITAKNDNGEILGAIFAAHTTQGSRHFTRLEYHRFEGSTAEGGKLYKITNKAFENRIGTGGEVTLGDEVALDKVNAWAHLTPEVTITNLETPLFGYYRVPGANTIDSSSPLGLSVFANALPELKAIDIAISRKNAEIADSKHITFVGQQLIQNAQNRKIELPRFVKGLGMGLNDSEVSAIHEHVPTLLTDQRIKDINFNLSMAGVKCGFSEAAAAEALSPLLLGNAQSVAEKGAVNALTGPIERGDAQTVSKHLQEIRKFAAESTVGQDILTAYTALSKQLIRIAQQKHPHKDYKHLEKELEQ